MIDIKAAIATAQKGLHEAKRVPEAASVLVARWVQEARSVQAARSALVFLGECLEERQTQHSARD